MALLRTQYIVDANGKRRGVLLSLKQHEKLMEDLHDLNVVLARHKEKPIALRSAKRRLSRSEPAQREL
jgi:hypothetical protein